MKERIKECQNSNQCTIFVRLFALAGLIHHLVFPFFNPSQPLGFLHFVLCLVAMKRAKSIFAFASFLLASALVLASHLNELSNHLLLELFVSLTLLARLLYWRISPSTKQGTQDLWYSLRWIVGGHLVLLYSFAAFSKLNTDFFHVPSSCVSIFLDLIAQAYFSSESAPGQIEAGSIKHVLILATSSTVLVVEWLIPVFLSVRKTRHTGIRLALVFHTVMAIIPLTGIASFSSLSIAFLTVFLDQSQAKPQENGFQRLFQISRSKHVLPITITTILSTAIVFGTSSIALEYRSSLLPAPYLTLLWSSIYLPVIWYLWRTVSSPVARSNDTSQSGFRVRRLLWLAPFFILGLSPYLGWRTQGALTMYSNLRLLDQRSNHLFVSAVPENRNNTMIDVLDTNASALNKNNKQSGYITSIEFRRIASQQKGDFYALIKTGNDVQLIGRFDSVLTDSPYLRPLSMWERLLIRHRNVSKHEHCECSW